MRPKALMILGSFVGVFAAAMDVAGLHSSVLLLAAGALFGKGYGVWETRAALSEAEEGR